MSSRLQSHPSHLFPCYSLYTQNLKKESPAVSSRIFRVFEAANQREPSTLIPKFSRWTTLEILIEHLVHIFASSTFGAFKIYTDALLLIANGANESAMVAVNPQSINAVSGEASLGLSFEGTTQLKDLVRAGFAFDTPTDSQERGENAPGLR